MGRGMSLAQGRIAPATPHGKGDTMRCVRPLVRWAGVLLGSMVVLAGCTYDAAIQQLSPVKQAELSPYRNIMTAGQMHTYVAHPTAAARTSYLQKLGLVQRFQCSPISSTRRPSGATPPGWG